MELRHFRYFVSVAEHLHFGRAATQLGMSQPPLSQQIRLLENEIGVPLFERTSRRVQLTEAGQQFLIEARLVLRHAETAVALARRAGSGETGEVAIGFSASVPLMPVVTQALSAFRTAYPDARLNLAEMPRGAQIEGLTSGKLEIGFMRGIDPPALPAMMTATLLLTEPLVVAMRSDHPLALGSAALDVAALRHERFILYREDFGAGFNEHLARLCERAGYTPDVVQEVTGSSSLFGLVAAGMGVTVITRSLATLHPENIVFRPLADRDASSRLWMIHRTHLPASPRHFVRLFLESRAAESARPD